VENGNVVTIADCASDRQCGAKHDLIVILHSFPNSIAEPERSRKFIILDVSSPDRPVFTYPLPQFSRRLFQFYRYRLKPRGIPLTRYAIQVALFLVINLLNNAAFAYNVPMAVHIIFRSGGLVMNMLLGWLLYGRR
jgi:UDP-xylose/UDP-N-acetylglucosamine transporter B4